MWQNLCLFLGGGNYFPLLEKRFRLFAKLFKITFFYHQFWTSEISLRNFTFSSHMYFLFFLNYPFHFQLVTKKTCFSRCTFTTAHKCSSKTRFSFVGKKLFFCFQFRRKSLLTCFFFVFFQKKKEVTSHEWLQLKTNIKCKKSQDLVSSQVNFFVINLEQRTKCNSKTNLFHFISKKKKKRKKNNKKKEKSKRFCGLKTT